MNTTAQTTLNGDTQATATTDMDLRTQLEKAFGIIRDHIRDVESEANVRTTDIEMGSDEDTPAPAELESINVQEDEAEVSIPPLGSRVMMKADSGMIFKGVLYEAKLDGPCSIKTDDGLIIGGIDPKRIQSIPAVQSTPLSAMDPTPTPAPAPTPTDQPIPRVGDKVGKMINGHWFYGVIRGTNPDGTINVEFDYVSGVDKNQDPGNYVCVNDPFRTVKFSSASAYATTDAWRSVEATAEVTTHARVERRTGGSSAVDIISALVNSAQPTRISNCALGDGALMIDVRNSAKSRVGSAEQSQPQQPFNGFSMEGCAVGKGSLAVNVSSSASSEIER